MARQIEAAKMKSVGMNQMLDKSIELYEVIESKFRQMDTFLEAHLEPKSEATLKHCCNMEKKVLDMKGQVKQIEDEHKLVMKAKAEALQAGKAEAERLDQEIEHTHRITGEVNALIAEGNEKYAKLADKLEQVRELRACLESKIESIAKLKAQASADKVNLKKKENAAAMLHKKLETSKKELNELKAEKASIEEQTEILLMRGQEVDHLVSWTSLLTTL